MFIDAEDEAAELHRRLANILDHYSALFADAIKGGLHMMSLAGQDAVLAAPIAPARSNPQLCSGASFRPPATSSRR